jgi:uncharacterized membrane protein
VGTLVYIAVVGWALAMTLVWHLMHPVARVVGWLIVVVYLVVLTLLFRRAAQRTGMVGLREI